jgi:3-deoxy-D-manno-octulosonic-acid transferase
MKQAAARAAYSALLRLATPAYLLRLWWRGRREPGYRQALGERLGFGPAEPEGRLWIHAVSFGETRAAAPLIEALRAQSPGLRLLLTHGTATGRAAGVALLRAGDLQCWLPYDTPGAVRRFLARHRPVVGVVMETEVWPNLLAAAHAARVPLVLANARLSERSQRKGQRLGALMRPAVAAFAEVLAQTEADAERLRSLGARRVPVLGNLKFDLAPSEPQVAQGRRWRAAQPRAVVLAASTREGEEPPLLDAWCALPAPRPLLVLVPRHPQRFAEVEALVRARGLGVQRRSALADTASAVNADVLLGDSMGEMALYYASADVALLGGSFEPLGGHNLIEAAACGCPLLMGPHTFNFAQAAEMSLAAGAAERVADLAAGVRRAVALASAPERAAMAEAATTFAAAHRGAATRMAADVLAISLAASRAT